MSGRQDFDQLARSVATGGVGHGISRRSVLRGVVAGTFGSLLLSHGARAAGADHSCDVFCASVFGKNTRGAKLCVQHAAQRTGLCYTCGPASAGGTQQVCCPENSSGHCLDYSSTTCCTQGSVCQNGACVPVCGGSYAPCNQDSDCCSGLLCVFSASSNQKVCQ